MAIEEKAEEWVRRILFDRVSTSIIAFDDVVVWYTEQREEFLTQESRASALQDKLVKFICKMI